MTDVTTVTANAESADDLSDQDYRDIYSEVREKMTLRQFVAVAGQHYSIAWWSQYERGEKPLTWHARAALRKIVGLPDLPLPVGAALEGAVDADATICRIGENRPARRVLLLATDESVTVHWNGSGPHVTSDRGQPAMVAVTPVTAQRKRVALWRPALPADWRERAAAVGVNVHAVVLAAIQEAEK